MYETVIMTRFHVAILPALPIDKCDWRGGRGISLECPILVSFFACSFDAKKNSIRKPPKGKSVNMDGVLGNHAYLAYHMGIPGA